MLHAFSDGINTNPLLLDTLEWLVAFAETTCDKKLKPTVVKKNYQLKIFRNILEYHLMLSLILQISFIKSLDKN
jgi:hypothetical protein